MRTEEEIREQITLRKKQIDEIIKIIENEKPQELYHYLKSADIAKLIIAVLNWVLEEQENDD